MTGTEMMMVCIVTERILKEEILARLRESGARGFTLTEAVGEGSRGVHASDWEGRNLKIEAIVGRETAERIIEEISLAYFENYAVIAYCHPVHVVRPGKFG